MWNVFILILAATISPAQTPATSTTSATPSPTVRAQTRLVVLDVLVTDSHGNPVKGLTLKDFQLRDEGSVRVLKTAEEHGIAAPAGSAAPAPAPAGGLSGPAVFSNKPPAGDVWNVLLLDHLNPSNELQSYAGQQLKKFVEQLPPEQPVALVVMGNPSKVAVPFSAGAAGVLKFLENKKSSASPPVPLGVDGLAVSIPMNTVNHGAPASLAAPVGGHGSPPKGGGGGGPITPSPELDQDQQLRELLSSFAGLADWLSHYPGRKNVYWLSTGFPRLNQDTIDPQIPQPERRAGLFGREQQRMDKLLQNARIAVFPIDLSGVRIDRTGIVEFQRIGKLEDFAEQTGGVLRHNDNDIAEMLRQEFNRSRDFYTLTYTPSGKNWNGQLRKISLSVKQRGYQLAYRQGYYAVNANFKPPTMDDFNRALKHGVEQVNDVVFSAHLNKDASHIVLDYFIDPASLQFATAAEGRHNADLDCEVTEYDASGNLLGTARAHSLARVPQKQWSQVSQAGLPGHVVIPAEPKLAFLKVGIRDSATGRFGTLEVALTPAASSR
jgi:VWFA-related protein